MAKKPLQGHLDLHISGDVDSGKLYYREHEHRCCEALIGKYERVTGYRSSASSSKISFAIIRSTKKKMHHYNRMKYGRLLETPCTSTSRPHDNTAILQSYDVSEAGLRQ